MRTHSPNETRSDPPCCGFIAQLLERRSDQEELTVTLSSQILTETRSQVDRAPMASASAQDSNREAVFDKYGVESRMNGGYTSTMVSTKEL